MSLGNEEKKTHVLTHNIPPFDMDSTTVESGNISDDGSVALAAILAALVVLVIASGVAYLLYRYYRKRSVHSMNFDNPVYKKTTTEDGFNLAGHQRSGLTSNQNGIRPGSGCSQYNHRQYGIMPLEDSLEPLTKNHQYV